MFHERTLYELGPQRIQDCLFFHSPGGNQRNKNPYSSHAHCHQRASLRHSVLKRKNTKVTMDPQVLLFYRYVEPLWSDAEVEAMMSWQRVACAQHKLSGRVRVANEGLNVNLSGPREGLRTYCSQLLEWGERSLAPIDFKLAPTTSKLEFKGCKVRPPPPKHDSTHTGGVTMISLGDFLRAGGLASGLEDQRGVRTGGGHQPGPSWREARKPAGVSRHPRRGEGCPCVRP